MRQYILFVSFHALYLALILAGAALLVWHGWLVLTFLVVVAAACKLDQFITSVIAAREAL